MNQESHRAQIYRVNLSSVYVCRTSVTHCKLHETNKMAKIADNYFPGAPLMSVGQGRLDPGTPSPSALSREEQGIHVTKEKHFHCTCVHTMGEYFSGFVIQVLKFKWRPLSELSNLPPGGVAKRRRTHTGCSAGRSGSTGCRRASLPAGPRPTGPGAGVGGTPGARGAGRPGAAAPPCGAPGSARRRAASATGSPHPGR